MNDSEEWIDLMIKQVNIGYPMNGSRFVFLVLCFFLDSGDAYLSLRYEGAGWLYDLGSLWVAQGTDEGCFNLSVSRRRTFAEPVEIYLSGGSRRWL